MQTPKLPSSDEMPFRALVRTRWSDEDTQGVLNNAAYLTLLEEARHRYFGELGLLEGNHFPFVLAQTNVCFLAPGRGGVEVEVLLSTPVLGRTSFVQLYRVREPEGGRVLCEAEALLVGWDNGRREKAQLSARFREAVLGREGRPAGS
jgi:acyl-CoA thioesterase FadM